jgi:hypothetical protein
VRCRITNAEALTARIPIGVITPRVRRTISRTRLDLGISLEKDKGAGEPAP